MLNTAFHSHIYPQFHCSGPYWESVIELVGEQRVGQLSEVQLAEGAHWVYVLSEDVSAQVWDLFWVKLVPKRRQKEEEDIEQRRSRPSILTRKATFTCNSIGELMIYFEILW